MSEANAVIYYVPSPELRNLGVSKLACNALAPYLARQSIAAWLGCGHPALDIARLAASELVTNAVQHTGKAASTHGTASVSDLSACSDDQEGVITLKLGQGRNYLRLGVTDLGSSCSQPSCIPLQATSLSAERGRGLAIVQALSRNRWGSYRLPVASARVVWCHLDLNPSPAQIEELSTASV